ncbi:MAG: DUF1295 domain-containing protein [Bacteroidales bacterium]|nr:DUF1295 domain-containing protein [Bacteroidales bacterium]
MSKASSSRKISFIILVVIYIAATFVGFISYRLAINNFENITSNCALLMADVVATVFVWIFGLVYKNVSVYDPYWSVLPPVMLTAWAIHCGHIGLVGVLVLIAVWYWGIRLTGNWAFTFKNLDTEDWRYAKYRTEKNPFIFQIINFFGLNLMPTLVVFAAMVPAVELLRGRHMMTGGLSIACETVPFDCTWLTWIGFAVCIAAATIQLVADTQRHRFARGHRGEVCKVGLWKHGRHPNYFGEISMWWGVWLMFASVNNFRFALTYLLGPVAMTCLFLFISIPLMEGRQLKNKPGYAEYKKETRILI